MSVVTPQRMSEFIEADRCDAVSLVKCDYCNTLIDALGPSWQELHEAGELYNGTVKCWRCREKEGES